MKMETTPLTIAQQLAAVLTELQEHRTGHVPKAVAVVLSEDTLVVTMHDALTPAEKALARTPTGAARVQEFHRQLFANSTDEMRKEIKRITGRQVREAAAEVETFTGTVVHAFTTGAMVQVFLLTPETLPGKANSSRQTGSKRVEQPADIKGFVQDLESLAIENENFRQVLYTTKNCQLVVMSLKPKEEIGEEVHQLDQILRVEEGTGELMIADVRTTVQAGTAVVVPAGAKHNLTNIGDYPLKLSTVYAPPNHRDGVVHATPKNASSDNEHFDGKTTE
jgi:mannose-6-phosphate isomerase-like protein (cupin superfamily)/uncharacterized protein YbcI